MFSKVTVLGLMAAIPLSLAAAVPSNLTHRAVEFLPKNATDEFSIQAAPQRYSGPWQSFPAMNTWVGTFDALFEANRNSMRSTGSTADDVGRINVAIREAAQIGVDERVILSIIMQGECTSVSCSGVSSSSAVEKLAGPSKAYLGAVADNPPESHGYVGVRTTYSPGEGIPTAGLMQCSNCAGFPGRTGLSQVCCASFTAMAPCEDRKTDKIDL